MEYLTKLNYQENNIKIHYSDDAESSAKDVIELLEEMSNYYEYLFNVKPTLTVILVNKTDYKKLFEKPYGMPFLFGSEKEWYINMPSEEGIIVDLIKEDYYSIHHPLEEKYINDYANSFVTLIGFHEIGHTYCCELGLDKLCHWFSEFMATYFAYCFMVEKSPKHAEIWMTINQVTLDAKRQLKYMTLDEFNEAYSTMASEAPGDYTWFQGMFNEKVDEIYKRYGILFIKNVLDTFKDGKMSSEDFEDKLIKIAPEFEDWLNDFRN
ncbi:hypothetical protein EZV73_12900 [Acidaminobacter sp. JC074]|uniref:hypothetical protein n=1 Tax=Acidaminobacter sp. JC074 TaxID=2530199 RepID=UPI001F0FFFF1|nr:hypothetical protein [Acidaminobacter sp. JC074]MCH4888483.1 hypothetical protein [Acidaminobacter sp. JC074]